MTAGKDKKYNYVKGIQCPRCDEKLWSKYTHDFHYCGCGYCFVDGGRDYLRYGWGIAPDRPNDGTITKEEWAVAAEATKKIGKPKQVRIRVEALPPNKKDNFPGYELALFQATMAAAAEIDKIKKKLKANEKATSKVKIKLPKEKADELSKSRDRKQVNSLRSGTGGSKRRPSRTVRGRKNKATVRK